MADFLTEKRQEIDTRLKELRPLYDEYLKLEKAKAALDGVDAPRRGTGADQALEAVRQNPGITVSELGDRLGIAQKNYLYRVMANLQEDGAVRKEGKGFVAA